MAEVKGIVDQFGRPVRKADLTAEVAGPTLTGVRSVLTGYPGDGLDPRRLAAILREADEGEPLRYFELAETVEERDLHYAGVLGTRKRSVSQLEVQVDAASDEARDVEAADLVREWLSRDELQGEMFDMLDAIGKGVAMTEILWETSQGQWRPARLEWRDPRWFRFDRRDGSTPLVRDLAGDAPLPPFKFVTTVIRAKSGLPVRSGIARIATWAWMFKAFTQRDWAIFVQTFGQPVRLGKYGAGATEDDKETLFKAVANIAGDCAAIIPESMAIEFVQSTFSGDNSRLFLERADWLDRQVSKAVLGQTATTDAIAGGHAVGREHREVQEDIERADARALSAILNRDLIGPWMQLEYGPALKPPRLRIGRAEERDLKTVIDGVARLVPLGLKVQASDLRDMLGLADPDEGAELLTPAAAPPTPPPTPRGEGGQGEEAAAQAAGAPALRPDAVDALAEAADDMTAGAMDALIGRLRALVEEAGSLDEVRRRLLETAPKLKPDHLAGLMRLAMVFAEISGRDDVAGG
jgi:phage gp29-like protein